MCTLIIYYYTQHTQIIIWSIINSVHTSMKGDAHAFIPARKAIGTYCGRRTDTGH